MRSNETSQVLRRWGLRTRVAVTGLAMAICLMAGLPAGAAPEWALDFQGEPAYVMLPDNTVGLTNHIHQTLEFSVGFWMRLGDRFDHQQHIIGTTCWPIGNHGWYIRHRGDTEIRVNIENGDRSRIQLDTPLQPETWHFVYATGDGSEIALYIDGNLIDTDDGGSPGNGDEPTPLTFGMSGLIPPDHPDYMGDHRFYGDSDVMLADVAIWDHERSAGEMQAHQQGELTGGEGGLVGYWPINEGEGDSVQDLSPNGNDGIIRGGQWVQNDQPVGPPIPEPPELPEEPHALLFDGSDSWVNYPHDVIPDWDQVWGFEAWVRPDNVDGRHTIIVERGGRAGSSIDFYCYIQEGVLGWFNSGHSDSYGSFEAGQWSHVAVLFDGSDFLVYQDGEFVGSEEADLGTSSHPETGGTLGGNQRGPLAYQFEGLMTEVRLWRGAIPSAAEVAGRMDQRLRGDENGLTAYWPLNEGSGDRAYDLSGHGLHGGILDAEWVQTDVPLAPAPPRELVKTPPPDSLEVNQGESLRLEVEVYEELEDDAEFEWILDGETVGTEAVYEVAETFAEDGGIYTLRVSHADPFYETEEFQIDVHIITSVLTPPQDLSALINQSATFEVEAIENSRFRWEFDGVVVSEARTHFISEVSADDYGIYTLTVEHDYFEDVVYDVSLMPPALVEMPPDPDVGVELGETVTLVILLYEQYAGGATVEWTRPDGTVTTLPPADPDLVIEDIGREDAGEYTVRVSHDRIPAEYDDEYTVNVWIREFAPAAGGLGLGVLAAAVALLGGAYGVRRMRK